MNLPKIGQATFIAASNSFGTCPKPPRYVPYKGTYVPYDGTYGTSDQGQMLEV
jgi:hypothetical protein